VIEILGKINISITLLKVSYKIKHQLRLMIISKCNPHWIDTL
jgi:hypothetical protein